MTIPTGITANTPTPASRERFAFVAMQDRRGVGAVLDALLKRPGSLIYELHQAGAAPFLLALGAATLVLLALNGVCIGSFSGGVQWWSAPAKVLGGTFLSALICLPSLYIFTCLSGAESRLGPLSGVLLAVLCQNALLWTGFIPVAWVFAQSTDSVVFMGTLHLIFWIVSMLFALQLLSAHLNFTGSRQRSYLRLWFLIFLLVCCQMTTALRPFVGRSETLLPAKKMFFLTYWTHSLLGCPQRDFSDRSTD